MQLCVSEDRIAIRIHGAKAREAGAMAVVVGVRTTVMSASGIMPREVYC